MRGTAAPAAQEGRDQAPKPASDAPSRPAAGRLGRFLRKHRRPLRAILLVAIACGVAGWGYWRYAYHWRKHHEPKADAELTSTEPLYSDGEFREVLERYDLGDGADLDQVVADSYVIPGLEATRTLEGDSTVATCGSMVPQGVCEAEGHVLVSAYCATKEHDSVIYVLGKDSHELERVVVLRGTPHVGGIAYDPEHRNVWLCGYDDDAQVAYLDALALGTIESYDLDSQQAPCEYDASYPVYTMERTSFLDYYDAQLYVGNFVSDQDGVSTVQTFPLGEDGMPYTLGNVREFLKSGLTEEGRRQLYGYLRYDSGIVGQTIDDASEGGPDDDDMLVPAGVSFINGKIQGFTVDGGMTVASQSGGPSDSTAYLFHNDGTVFDALRTADDAAASFRLPPMLEQVSLTDGRLYLCFESAAYAYRARLNDKVDRIVVLRLDDGAQGAGQAQ